MELFVNCLIISHDDNDVGGLIGEYGGIMPCCYMFMLCILVLHESISESLCFVVGL